MDYRWFFDSNGVYNPGLSVASLLYSSVMYYTGSVSINGSEYKNSVGMAEYFGMKDVENIRLRDYYTDNNVTDVTFGHRSVTYNGVTKEIMLMAIKGTSGVIEEWSSNFDVGEIATFDQTPDWCTPKIHKGFDITSQRIMRLADDYAARHGINGSNTSYWITGHSRGGAVANIIGAYYEYQGRNSFTYTFAAPNTTLDYTAGYYKSIFNVVNKDDFVTYLPVENWGYYKYGRTASASISSEYSGQFKSLTGVKYSAQGESGRNTTINAVSKIISGDPRVELYSYDGASKTVNRTFWSDSTRATYLKKIPDCAAVYSENTLSGSRKAFWGSKFTSVQAPAFLLQLLASVMAGKTSYADYVAIDVASKYEPAKYALAATAIAGITKPHYTESYYVLSKNLTAGDFR